MNNYNDYLNLLNENGFEYIITDNANTNFHGFGMGDLLFCIVSLENNLINSPITISINFFLNNYTEFNSKKTRSWNNDYYNSFIFRLKLINDICLNSDSIKKSDFIFIFNKNNIVYDTQFNLLINYRLIKNYQINIKNTFFDNINDSDFIVFHTKIRLNDKFDYQHIKNTLKILFSKLKITKSKKIYLLGEKIFLPSYEQNVNNIQCIYEELLELYNNNEVIDLTINEIYNSLNYDNYKRDISIMNKAKWNIVIGQGGHLCSSLLFGKCIFYDPIDEIYFFNNMNLFNSGHRYFKRFEKFCEYLEYEL
jgi:hypothetical protein